MTSDKERTEEEMVTQAVIQVTLGGQKYDVKPLVIRDSREWRKEVVTVLASLPKQLKATTDEPEEFGQALEALLVAMPDTVVDLFFKYAKDLPRDEIEGKATDQELAFAFNQIIVVAFPLAGSLTETMTRLSQ